VSDINQYTVSDEVCVDKKYDMRVTGRLTNGKPCVKVISVESVTDLVENPSKYGFSEIIFATIENNKN